MRDDLIIVQIHNDAFDSTLWIYFKVNNSNKQKNLYSDMSTPKPIDVFSV